MKANMSVLAQRYAKAYDSAAKDNAAAQLNMELLKESLSSLSSIEAYINNPTIPSAVQMEIAAKAYGKEDSASAFIKLLISAGRFYLAPEIIKELQTLLDSRLGIKRVTVTSAGELIDGSAEGRLKQMAKILTER